MGWQSCRSNSHFRSKGIQEDARGREEAKNADEVLFRPQGCESQVASMGPDRKTLLRPGSQTQDVPAFFAVLFIEADGVSAPGSKRPAVLTAVPFITLREASSPGVKNDISDIS